MKKLTLIKYLKILLMVFYLPAVFSCRECIEKDVKGTSSGEGKELFAEKDCCQKHLQCQDGLWCTGIERCNCWGVCVAGTPPDCNDGNPATVDKCVNDYIGRPGVRGNPGVDGEIGTGHCEHELVGRPCQSVADCEDFDACTNQRCVANFCVYENVNCDDGDICTSDSCDRAMGCVHNAMQNCCTGDSDCNDNFQCTIDRCNILTNQCTHSPDTGATCTFGNECFEPGTCSANGLCMPGSLRVPSNDTCAGATSISISSIGEACVEGSTLCGRHDYSGSCASGMNSDVVYTFDYSIGLGAETGINGANYTRHEHGSCEIIDGTSVGCCTNNWWEYIFNFSAAGNYRTGIETSNYTQDLTSFGVKHRVAVYIDGNYKGEIVNSATTPQTRRGSIFLGYVTAGSHTLRFQWVNDWYLPPFDSNIKIHRVWIQPDNAPYQLYSYNVIVDADFDSVLYARRECDTASSQIICNNNCVSSSLLDCGFYGLAPNDSAFTLPPYPVGTISRVWLFVDGVGGEKGRFQLKLYRIQHKNNPCATVRDNSRLVDGTLGGEFRGNLNGYLNDMYNLVDGWVKTPCHAGISAGSDWPARAWFVLKPQSDSVYRIWTDEATPVTWFDTVIEVWDISTALGCGGVKTYMGCAHITGRESISSSTVYQFNATNGRVYLVGISNYERPVAGNYIAHIDIM